MSHINSFHREFKSETITAQKTLDFEGMFERNIYGWLDWICNDFPG